MRLPLILALALASPLAALAVTELPVLRSDFELAQGRSPSGATSPIATRSPASAQASFVPRAIPQGAKVSPESFIRFKFGEITSGGDKPRASLIVRFSCEPLRYSAWIASHDVEVGGDAAQVAFDDQAVLMIAAFKQSPKVLVLEDAWGEGEKAFIDRIRSTKEIAVSYADDDRRHYTVKFHVEGVKRQLAAVEASCFGKK